MISTDTAIGVQTGRRRLVGRIGRKIATNYQWRLFSRWTMRSPVLMPASWRGRFDAGGFTELTMTPTEPSSRAKIAANHWDGTTEDAQ